MYRTLRNMQLYLSIVIYTLINHLRVEQIKCYAKFWKCFGCRSPVYMKRQFILLSPPLPPTKSFSYKMFVPILLQSNFPNSIFLLHVFFYILSYAANILSLKLCYTVWAICSIFRPGSGNCLVIYYRSQFQQLYLLPASGLELWLRLLLMIIMTTYLMTSWIQQSSQKIW